MIYHCRIGEHKQTLERPNQIINTTKSGSHTKEGKNYIKRNYFQLPKINRPISFSQHKTPFYVYTEHNNLLQMFNPEIGYVVTK